MVAEAIGGFAAVTLVSTLGDLEGVLPDAITRRLPPGTVATGLVVTEIEAQLTPRLARSLQRPDRGDAPTCGRGCSRCRTALTP